MWLACTDPTLPCPTTLSCAFSLATSPRRSVQHPALPLIAAYQSANCSHASAASGVQASFGSWKQQGEVGVAGPGTCQALPSRESHVRMGCSRVLRHGTLLGPLWETMPVAACKEARSLSTQALETVRRAAACRRHQGKQGRREASCGLDSQRGYRSEGATTGMPIEYLSTHTARLAPARTGQDSDRRAQRALWQVRRKQGAGRGGRSRARG